MDNSYTAFAPLYDAMMHDVDYDAWAIRLDSLLRQWLPSVRNCTVADCACGTGAITMRLARKGYRMTGLDLSEDMLMSARTAAMRQGLQIPFVHMDMCALQLHRPVDCVNCSCDGVNYLLSRPRVIRFFEAAFRALKPGGLLMFDVSTRYKLSEVVGGHCFGEDLPACTYLWRNAYDPEKKLVEMQLNMFVPKGDGTYTRLDETHVQRAHSDTELRSALQECGFELLGAYDDLTDAPVSKVSQRALYVARKPLVEGNGDSPEQGRR